jgi:hypothetical protein
MINSSAQQCGQRYVDASVNLTNAETDRASQMGVTIDTIEISDGNPSDDHAIGVLRRLIKSPAWFPTQLAYMTDTTKGQTYAALNYDAAAISRIYETAAKQIRVKLSQ